MSVVKERPILFSAPMVRAILEGRKTQTRRIMKLTCAGHVKEPNGHRRWHPDDKDAWRACPYGKPGDRLWVKEAHRFIREWLGLAYPQVSVSCQYRASEGTCAWSDYKVVASATDPTMPNGWSKTDARIGVMRGFTVPVPVPWRSSIFMPRWASRITLEIVSVRVERLNEIIPADVIKEGCPYLYSGTCPEDAPNFVGWYKNLWESINGPDSWAANPWVWVVEFRRIA